jgi:hypothetical protein
LFALALVARTPFVGFPDGTPAVIAFRTLKCQSKNLGFFAG